MSARVGRKLDATGATAGDEQRMRELVRFTMRTMSTDRPVPFGALIVETDSGALLQRGLNAVARENDPSSHAELRTVRLACKKLKRRSLAGYTLYSTCEPCPMCMANCLWARLDRVVYGATIKDANRHCDQIKIPAKEVARHSDIPCLVHGPLMRDLCCTLFTHPKMLRAFEAWRPGGSTNLPLSAKKSQATRPAQRNQSIPDTPARAGSHRQGAKL